MKATGPGSSSAIVGVELVEREAGGGGRGDVRRTMRRSASPSGGDGLLRWADWISVPSRASMLDRRRPGSAPTRATSRSPASHQATSASAASGRTSSTVMSTASSISSLPATSEPRPLRRRPRGARPRRRRRRSCCRRRPRRRPRHDDHDQHDSADGTSRSGTAWDRSRSVRISRRATSASHPVLVRSCLHHLAERVGQRRHHPLEGDDLPAARAASSTTWSSAPSASSTSTAPLTDRTALAPAPGSASAQPVSAPGQLDADHGRRPLGPQGADVARRPRPGRSSTMVTSSHRRSTSSSWWLENTTAAPAADPFARAPPTARPRPPGRGR